MKIHLNIHPRFSQETLSIEAPQMTPRLQEILHFVNQLNQEETLTGRIGENIYPLTVSAIYRFYTENKQVLATDDQHTYLISARLYQLLEKVGPRFLQISQSEIINIDHIDHFSFTKNGLVKIFFTNGDYTYSSRRYLKTIKEKLQC